jgi:hypothetical protein
MLIEAPRKLAQSQTPDDSTVPQRQLETVIKGLYYRFVAEGVLRRLSCIRGVMEKSGYRRKSSRACSNCQACMQARRRRCEEIRGGVVVKLQR